MWLVCYCSDVGFSFSSLTLSKIEGDDDDEKTQEKLKKRFVKTKEEEENEVRTDYFIE